MQWRLPIFRTVLVLLGAVAPFFFPVPFVIVLSIGIAFFVPPMALLMGGLIDLTYFDGVGVPYYTILGALIAALALFVQQFIKTRII